MTFCDFHFVRLEALMKRVLVTGGAGFIGSHLAEALTARGLQVRVVDSFVTGRIENLASIRDKIEFIEADVADPVTAAAAVADVDTVFHEAAIPSVPVSFEHPMANQHSGEVALMAVLNAARKAGVRRVIFAASAAAYGNLPGLPKREDMPTDPRSPYAVSKLAAENYLSVFAQETPIDCASLRYFNVFGPRQDPKSPYSGVISIFCDRLAQGIQPMIYGDGGQTRDFIYVEDVVRANLAAMDAPGRLNGAVINVARGEETSVKRLMETLARLMGKNIEPAFAPERTGDVRQSVADVSRAEKLLGFRAQVGVEEGLRRLIEWMGSMNPHP